LLDTGYAFRKGFLPPYKKVRCHLEEFDENSPPTNARELFNLHQLFYENDCQKSIWCLKEEISCARYGAILGFPNTSRCYPCLSCVT